MQTGKTSFAAFWQNFPTFSKLRAKEKKAAMQAKKNGMPRQEDNSHTSVITSLIKLQ
jgi:hypothetical protein